MCWQKRVGGGKRGWKDEGRKLGSGNIIKALGMAREGARGGSGRGGARTISTVVVKDGFTVSRCHSVLPTKT